MIFEANLQTMDPPACAARKIEEHPSSCKCRRGSTCSAGGWIRAADCSPSSNASIRPLELLQCGHGVHIYLRNTSKWETPTRSKVALTPRSDFRREESYDNHWNQ